MPPPPKGGRADEEEEGSNKQKVRKDRRVRRQLPSALPVSRCVFLSTTNSAPYQPTNLPTIYQPTFFVAQHPTNRPLRPTPPHPPEHFPRAQSFPNPPPVFFPPTLPREPKLLWSGDDRGGRRESGPPSEELRKRAVSSPPSTNEEEGKSGS